MLPIAVTALSLILTEPLPQSKPHMQVAEFCMSSGEQISGLNKICYYECPSGTVAINVKSYELCPLNIDN